jgi:hypothetical protein
VRFERTSEVAVRRSLGRASLYGVPCLPQGGMRTDEAKADAGRFFRGLAALEPDITQRERLEKVATAFETKGWGDYDKVLSGKE